MNNTDNNENVKVDRRVIKTKKAIRNAFAKLLTLKNIDEITIKDIADEADVNRKTIYNYYNGTYEIQDEIENEIVEGFNVLVKDLNTNIVESTALVFDKLTTILNQDIEFYGHLIDSDVNSMLVRKMINVLKNRLSEEFLKKGLFKEDKVGIIADYVCTGMIGAYQSWFNQGRIQPIEEFSKDVAQLVNNGVEAMKK